MRRAQTAAYAPNHFLGTCLDEEWVTSMGAKLGVSRNDRDSLGRLVHSFLQPAMAYTRFKVADPRTQPASVYADECIPSGAAIYGADAQVDANGEVTNKGVINGSLIVELSGWNTHTIASLVFSILAAEVYGYHVAFYLIGSGDRATERMSSVRSGVCTPTHVNFDVWTLAARERGLAVFANDSYVAGATGYLGYSGIYTTTNFVKGGVNTSLYPSTFYADFWKDYVKNDALIDALSYAKFTSNPAYYPIKKGGCADNSFGCENQCSRSYVCTLREAMGGECMVVMMHDSYDPGYLQAAIANLDIPTYFCFLGYGGLEKSFYRQQVAATRTQIGKDTRDAAVNKAVHTAGSLWPGLQLIQWSELHNIPGITAYTAQTLLRLKANRLSMWNYEKADLSCSNPECSQVVQSSVQHLLWECPKAKLVWNYFYALWAKIRITPGHDPAIWIFSLDLPDTPRRAWTTIKRHIIGHKFSNEHLQDHLYSVAHMLASWRLGRSHVAAVLKAYVDCFLSQTDAIPLTPSDTRGVYLLFFDGGSRGNPGPGGTGSIIVRVHKDSHTASLIWVASMAYSRKDTTNNFAEYWGLIHGLREAQRSHFEPLYVIGDSALIISQQRMHRSPRQHRLARLYQTSRRLADCIDIRGWYHHYRAFNKMADSAANLAMDTRTSTQVHFPTQRAAFNNLTQDLDNDVMHWLMRSSEDPRSLDNTRQPHRVFLPYSSPEQVVQATDTFGENGFGEPTTNLVRVDIPPTKINKCASLRLQESQPIGQFLSKFALSDLIVNDLIRLYFDTSTDANEPDPEFRAACNWLKVNYETWWHWLDRLPLCDLSMHTKYTVSGCANDSDTRTMAFEWNAPHPENASQPFECGGGVPNLPAAIVTSRTCAWILEDDRRWMPWIDVKPTCDASFYTYNISACDRDAKRIVTFFWLIADPEEPALSAECIDGVALPASVTIDC
ncbi:Transmembrane protein, partial [Globisporangium splendens]